MFAETMSFGELMFACGIGVGTVFVGLICLIFITRTDHLRGVHVLPPGILSGP